MITGLIILYAVVGIILLILHEMTLAKDIIVFDMLIILTIGVVFWPIILIGIYWPKDILQRVVIKKRRN